ncbi:MAG: hypothetical protein ACRDYX_03435 [Egibacteraceae bacterium]
MADARAHLNVLGAALRGPRQFGQRRGLQVDAAETACLAACSARSCGCLGETTAFFSLARSLADQSQVAGVRGCALAVYSVLHARSSGTTTRWLGFIASTRPAARLRAARRRW